MKKGTNITAAAKLEGRPGHALKPGFYQPPYIGPDGSSLRSKPISAIPAKDSDLSLGNTGNEELSFGLRILLLAYLTALVFPILLKVGSATFTATRLFLLVVTLPVMVKFFSTSKLLASDILILLYVTWASICLIVNHGFNGALEPAGSHFFEVAGAYFLARLTMKEPSAYIFWAKCLFFSVLVVLPFAINEAMTGRPVILEFLRSFVPTYASVSMPKRLELERVQAIFEHPILYGVFCASAFSPAVLVVARNSNAFVRTFYGTLVAVATFLSLATGAYVSVIWQFIMIGWNGFLRSNNNRWRLLAILSLIFYVTIDLLSNRTPFEVFVTYFTFDTNSAYNRINIWDYGTAEVIRHPVFGIGFKDWTRAHWMSSSFDNFWLLRAMRYGFPGILLLMSAVIIAARGITYRIDVPNRDLAAVSTSQVCALIGSAISLVTVDVWSGSHSLFFFSIGSIVALNQSFSIQNNIDRSIL
jgi:hypothetical protein